MILQVADQEAAIKLLVFLMCNNDSWDATTVLVQITHMELHTRA